MKNKLILYSIILIFLIIFAVFYKSLKDTNIYTPETKINNDIPIFSAELLLLNENSTSTEIFKSDQFYLLNIWASWCAPCREEMPSLDILQSNKNFQDLIVLPINVGKENKDKAKKFFEDLQIKNLELYYDDSIKLANSFSLIGLPTTIFINKKGEEFARIIGSIDFEDKKFIKWLSEYN